MARGTWRLESALPWLLGAVALLVIAGRGYLANVLESQRVRVDRLGDGHFGASRTGHVHEGVDLVVDPGDPVFSPFSGHIAALGYVYRGDRRYRLVRVKGRGMVVDLMYVEPLEWVRAGVPVRSGQQVGTAQSVRVKYGPAMLDHVHVELRTDAGVLLNPEEHLRISRG